MGKTSRFALLALSLLTIPAGAAFAQNEMNDGGKAAAAKAHHSAATPAHPKAKAAGKSASSKKSNSAADPNVPGATGQSIVKGDSSTIAGDRKATLDQRNETTGK